jgi:hypothetical protein
VAELLRRAAVAGIALGALASCDDCNKKPAAPSSDAASPGASGADDGGPMNVTPVPTASVARMVNPDNLPAYSGPTGSVEGTVMIVGDHPAPVQADFSRCPDAEKTWGKEFREGPVVDAGARALADAVVVVTGYKGFYVPEKKEAKTVEIKGCAYESLTVTMTFGQRLDVKNDTNDFWTPVLEPSTHMVMMMAAPHGDPVKLYPKKWGRHLLVDRDRKYVGVDVFVFFHPLHAASDASGHYRIDGLPVGKVQVNAAHPRFEAATTVDLDVREGLVSKVDLVLRFDRADGGIKPPPDAGFHPVLR